MNQLHEPRPVFAFFAFLVAILVTIATCDTGGDPTRVAITNNGIQDLTTVNVTAADGTFLGSVTAIKRGTTSPFFEVEHISLKGVKISCSPAVECINRVLELQPNADNLIELKSSENGGGSLVFSKTSLTTSEVGSVDTFTIKLESEPVADVTFSLSSSDATEATVSPGVLTFTSSNWNNAQTVTATGVDDALTDNNVAYTIETGTISSSDALYDGVDPPDVSGTNIDDETAQVTVTPSSSSPSPIVTDEDQGASAHTVLITFSVGLQPTADVAVTLSGFDATEVSLSTTTIQFTSADNYAAKTLTLTAIDDGNPDGDQTYTITTSNVVSGDGNYNNKVVDDIFVKNLDNPPAITVTPTSMTTTEAAGPSHSQTFTVVLTTQPTVNVSIGLSSTNATNGGSPSPTSLTFTTGACPSTGNWCTAQTVTVTDSDDAVVDPATAYTIVTAPASAVGDPNYNGMNASDISATSTDNDGGGW